MNKKQDRQGVRTPSDIERKYDLGKNIGEMKEIATAAQRSANEALNSVSNLEKKVNEVEEKIDNVEINGGTTTGFISFEVDDDGNLYVCTSGDGNPPELEYDETTGNLYYVTEGV